MFDKHLNRVFFDVLGLEAAARLLELAYAAEKYQVRIDIRFLAEMSNVPIFILQVKTLTEELVAVIGKCSLTRNKQEVIL